jgi:WhiB family redox-sensing transcriptional regulator
MNQGVFAPEDGACVGHPTEWWFPLQKTGKREELAELRKNTSVAKSICISCIRIEQCLEYSLQWEPWGIWGGMDEQERARIRWERKVNLGREGRIVFKGVGLRDANGGEFLLERAAKQ